MTMRHRWARGAVLAAVMVAGLVVGEGGGADAWAQFGRFGQNKVHYLDFDWRVYHAPHFDVYYYPEEEAFLEQVVSSAESAYLYLSKSLDHEPKFRIPLIYYKTHGEFEQTNIELGFIDLGVLAFAEPLEKRMVLPIDQPPDFLYKVITHELTHIFQFSILFSDSAGRALRGNPAGWLMEGMASHMAQDEDSLAIMFIRDAVVSGLVPPITRVRGGSQLILYRYGQAAFEFIEKEFGPEGIRSFLNEYRKVLLTENLGKAIKEAFGVEPEEFDRRFKRFLMKKYVPTSLAKNEPEDHGKEVGIKLPGVVTFSPALSPSGDLIAVMTNKAEDLDIFVINAKDGEVIRNLTKGISTDYDYLITGLYGGRIINDISWSPGGDEVAVFARKDNKRLLLLYNAVTGKQVLKQVLDVDQAASPAFSPDGKRIAFVGNKKGQVDIFEYNLETKALANITNDSFYDSNPSWSEDGKTILYNRRINSYEKVFLLDYDDPAQKTQLTFGETSDIEPTFSRDGKRVYYASDGGAKGIYNIFSLDLETGEMKQYTDLISGAFSPRELPEEEGKRRLVTTSYWQGRFRLYTVDQDKPVKVISPSERVEEPQEIVPFEPPLKLTVDEAEKRPFGKLKYHIETVPQVGIGVASDGTVFGDAYLVFSDLLGDHRIWVNAQTVASFNNFDVGYINMKNRLQWLVGLADYRDFVVVQTSSSSFVREQVDRVTSARAGLVYPFSTHTRVQGSAGVMNRDIVSSNLALFESDPGFVSMDPNEPVPDPSTVPKGATIGFLDFNTETGTSPFASVGIVNDTTIFKEFGAWHGKRVAFNITSVPASTGAIGTFTEYDLDFRAYRKLTRRSLLAWRLVADVSRGDGAPFFSIGGYNQIRGFRYREFLGDSAAFTNLELRFPLIDELRFPFGSIRQIRGLLFFDAGAAWTQDGLFWDKELVVFRDFKLYDSDANRFQDGRASYGIGFSFRLGPFDLNWNFARRLPFGETHITNACAPSGITDIQTFVNFVSQCPIEETDDTSINADFYIGYAF